MAIEFPCPTCSQLVRTPDAAAGKKGKCPHCGTITVIPAPQSQPPRPTTSPAAPKWKDSPAAPKPASGAPIEFSCPSCTQLVRTPPSAAGKKGKCPHCQAVVQIPAPSPKPAATRTETNEAIRPTPAKPRPAPKPATSIPKPVKPAPPPEPFEDELPALAPLDSGWGTSNSSASFPGLTPLDASSSDPFGGLTPLNDPLDGLAPLPASGYPAASGSPFGSAGGAGSPFITPDPFAAGSLAAAPSQLNPYASPALGYPAQPVHYQQPVSDANRRGLPWEREASMETFWETVQLILGSPGEAFARMRRTGGFGNPMGFITSGIVVGQLATTFYSGLIALVLVVAFAPQPDAIAGVAIWTAISVARDLFAAVMAGTIGTFIGAAIWHVIFLIFGAGRAGYEGTYRIVAFVNGASYTLGLIPLVGPLIGAVYAIVLLIYAVIHTHEVSGGRAAAAVLIPGMLLCGCGCAVIFFAVLSGFTGP